MKKLFVGNLPYSANETEVQNFFADHGVTVDSVTVMRDRFTGQARGFGFVEINDDALAAKTVEVCHGLDLMGRTLVVNEARPPREGGGPGGARGPGGGGGRGRAGGGGGGGGRGGSGGGGGGGRGGGGGGRRDW